MSNLSIITINYHYKQFFTLTHTYRKEICHLNLSHKFITLSQRTMIECKRIVFRMRLRISFFFDVLFDDALNIVWWIFSFVIWRNSSFSKYVAFAISSMLTSVSDEKKNSFKQCVLFVFVKAVVSFDLRNNDVLSLKEIFLFFAHLSSFHVFWAFSAAFSTVFQWFLRRILFIVLFLLLLTFFHAFRTSSMIFSFASSVKNCCRALFVWLILIRTSFHLSSNFDVTLTEIAVLRMKIFMT